MAARDRERLRTDRTVSRGLVHKSAVEQVLLTDARRVGNGRFAIAAHLPRSHMLFGDTAVEHHDATLLGEAFRQAVIYVTHRFLRVPGDVHFLMGTTSLELEDVEVSRVLPHPQTLELTLEAHDLHRWRDGTLRDYEARMQARLEGRRLVSGAGLLATLAPRRYATMRGAERTLSDALPRLARDPAALHPGVGRADPRNRLLTGFAPASEGYAATLAADLDHPVFFDHPQDHLPGSLLVEALRQIAIAATAAARGWDPDRLLPTRLAVEFKRFAELGAAVECAATVAGGPRTAAVAAAVRQGGEPVALAQLDLRPA